MKNITANIRLAVLTLLALAAAAYLKCVAMAWAGVGGPLPRILGATLGAALPGLAVLARLSGTRA